MESTYSIEFPQNEAVIIRIGDIFKNNDNTKNTAHLRWQYLDLPTKKSYCAFAVDAKGVDAANYNLFVVKAKINGIKNQLICQSLDTLTDKDHRGKGLFIKLAHEIYEDCDKSGIKAVYGFPNSNSAPGFFKKLGWTSYGHPPFIFYLNNLLFPLSFLTNKKFFYLKNIFFSMYLFIRKIVIKSRSYELINSADFNKDYDDLWGKFSTNISSCVWRDSEYMKWRYSKKPNKNYKYFSVYNNNKLMGVIIYTTEVKHGGKIGYIMDLIYENDGGNFGEILVNACLQELISQKVDLVLTWSQEEYCSYSLYRNSLFFKLPRKLQPIKLFFGYRKNFLTNEEVNSFYVTYSDSDTV